MTGGRIKVMGHIYRFQMFVFSISLVCVCVCVGGAEDNVLWIAMAGTHQIWALFLADGKLPKGR